MLLFSGYVKATPLFSWVPVDLAKLGAFVLAGCAFVVWLRRPEWIPRGAALVLTLWLTFVPATLLAPHTSYAQAKIFGIWVYTLIAVLTPMFLLTTPTRRMLTAAGAFLSGAVIVVSALLTLDPAQEGRLAAVGSSTLASGRGAGAAAMVCAAVALLRTGWLRWTAFAVAASFGAATVATGSRGPVLGILLGVLVLLLFTAARARTGILRCAAVVGAGAAVWIALQFVPIHSVQRIVQTGGGGMDWSSEARLRLLEAGARIAAHHPEGVGWGGLVNHLQPLEVLTKNGWAQYPHNVFVEVLVEAGWVAGLLFLIFAGLSLALLARHARRLDGGIWLGLAVFFLVNAMVSGDLNGNRPALVALAVAWTLRAQDMARPDRPVRAFISRIGRSDKPGKLGRLGRLGRRQHVGEVAQQRRLGAGADDHVDQLTTPVDLHRGNA
jgi:O-antigen ligase